MKTHTFCLICVLAVVSSHLAAQTSLSPAQIQQHLLAQPPQAIAYQSQKAAAHGLTLPIVIKQYVQADLGGTGAFNYIVALYGVTGSDGGYLRAFKIQGNNLVLAGDEDDHGSVGGFGAQLQLIDVNGDGIPEIEVTGMPASGRYELLPDLYSWTGSSLHNMLGAVKEESGELVDIDGDGILEVVGHPVCDVDSNGNPTNCGTGYDVYKLVGNNYQFFKTFAQDPTGTTGSNGQSTYVRAFCTKLTPNRFSAGELPEGKKNNPGGQGYHWDGFVQLRFGGLQQVNGTLIDVGQVDTNTIVIAPHLLPAQVSVRRGDGGNDEKDQNDTCSKTDGRILVDVPGSQFLNNLQKLNLNGPLSAGDEVEVKLTAKLRDGSPVGAVFKARIVGNGQDGGQKH